jgi:putative ABC transport system permease protein
MFLFAIKTLAYDRGKLLIALVGVIFSIVLVNVQMGLLLGLIRKGSLLVDHAEADIWVGRRGVENVDFAHEIPELWLNRVRGLPGVDRAEPFVVGQGTLTLPDGGYENIWVIGAEATATMGRIWNVSQGSAGDLRRPDSVAFDEMDAWKIGYPDIGDVLEINGNRARVVATTNGIVAFTNTPFVFTDYRTAQAYCRIREGFCSYFLIKAADGVNHQQLRETIARQVPDADVMLATEFSRKSRYYWLARTGIGISFGAATVLGLLVGLVMVSQTLYAMTLDHLGDYATLKAIGADDRQVLGILVIQALVIAIFGTLVGTTGVFAIQRLASTPIAPIDIHAWVLLASLLLTGAICLAAALLPSRRLRRLDPVTVLQE